MEWIILIPGRILKRKKKQKMGSRKVLWIIWDLIYIKIRWCTSNSIIIKTITCLMELINNKIGKMNKIWIIKIMWAIK